MVRGLQKRLLQPHPQVHHRLGLAGFVEVHRDARREAVVVEPGEHSGIHGGDEVVHDEEDGEPRRPAEVIIGCAMIPGVVVKLIGDVGLASVRRGPLRVDDGVDGVAFFVEPYGIIRPARRELEVFADEFVVLLLAEAG